MDLLEFTKVELDVLRQDSGWQEFLTKVTYFCEKHNVKVADMNGKYIPMQRSRQFYRGAINYHRFHADMFLGVIDRQVQGLNNWFDEILRPPLAAAQAGGSGVVGEARAATVVVQAGGSGAVGEARAAGGGVAFEGVDVVFHTASADYTKNDSQLHYKVNVEGTKTVIDACKICKVKRLIYTSSGAVVFDGVHGHFDVNESKPYPDKFPYAYAQTKAEAEKLVIKANNTSGLLTCCIRPGTIFGPGDNIVSSVDYCGRTQLIIGDGKNCDDFVYVENVVHCHICAERALCNKEGAEISRGKAYFVTNVEQINLWDFLYEIYEEFGYISGGRWGGGGPRMVTGAAEGGWEMAGEGGGGAW
ncbi:3beta-hydroxysteroid-dehydrogenase/decarboxylase-like [Setaria italica]|uniref:3beta-hydroxysteroid- dehydrogenase/decarboxylase-like n=1 Tax=Setaria italica TaxID=4555 RepID=UPI0006487991|nr:3beta-hydroxysteroid-dehydrogenase/decarboxylase-like [Setaria italica]